MDLQTAYKIRSMECRHQQFRHQTQIKIMKILFKIMTMMTIRSKMI